MKKNCMKKNNWICVHAPAQSNWYHVSDTFRSARAQPCWRPCTRSCTSTASPWWAWAGTMTKWRTVPAEEEEGASSSPSRYRTPPPEPPQRGCAVSLQVHMHVDCEKLLGWFFFCFSSPSTSWLGFWVFTRDRIVTGCSGLHAGRLSCPTKRAPSVAIIVAGPGARPPPGSTAWWRI